MSTTCGQLLLVHAREHIERHAGELHRRSSFAPARKSQAPPGSLGQIAFFALAKIIPGSHLLRLLKPGTFSLFPLTGCDDISFAIGTLGLASPAFVVNHTASSRLASLRGLTQRGP